MHFFLGLKLEEWAAVATIANGLLVSVLIIINILYLRSADRQANAALAQAVQSQRQADAAIESLKILKEKSIYEDEQQIIRACDLLQASQREVLRWRDLMKDKWGMAPSSAKLLPDDWSMIVYQAGKISVDLSKRVTSVGSQIAEANDKINGFLVIDPRYRDARVPPMAYRLLDEAVPHLNGIVIDFEARRQCFYTGTKT